MNTHHTAPLMGTLAWAKTSNAQLTEAEKIKLSRNVASLQAEMIFDEFRFRLGYLHPAVIDWRSLTPPDSKLVKDVDEFVREVYDDVLWNHCVRSYYFGALVAAFEGIKFDREIFYAAAVCHDAGAHEEKAGSVRTCCFAHSGGQLTHDRLLACGHAPEVASHVGNAISTHMNIYVPFGEYPAESTLTAVGATCDVFGVYARRINPNTLADIVKRWPRAGLLETFEAFLSKQHLEDSRTAILGQMGAFAVNGTHPIEALLAAEKLS